MKSRKMWGALVLSVAALAAVQAATTTGVVLKPDEIKAEPFKDAKTLGAVDKGDTVEITSKQGGWLQVTAGKVQGWVRMLSVKQGAASGANAGKELSGVVALSTGRAGTGQVVSSTGVRGLGEEDLKAAKFNAAELKLADAGVVAPAAAASFAQEAKLTIREVAFLPEPVKPAAASPSPTGRR